MKIEKIVFTFLILICMGTIYIFSNQTGGNSQGLSDKVTIKLIESYEMIRGKKISTEMQKKIISELRFWIRKLAHFMIYLVFGFLAYGLFKTYRFKYPVIWALSLTLFYATSDEIHQLFVANRSGKVMDVLIDMCGSFVGVMFSKKIYRFFIRRKNKKRILVSESLKNV